MTVQTQQVLEKAIHLPPVDRAELVERILSSFDRPNREEIDALWAKKRKMHDAYDQVKSRQSLQAGCLRKSTGKVMRIDFLDPLTLNLSKLLPIIIFKVTGLVTNSRRDQEDAGAHSAVSEMPGLLFQNELAVAERAISIRPDLSNQE